jgi:hypothetical protein
VPMCCLCGAGLRLLTETADVFLSRCASLPFAPGQSAVVSLYSVARTRATEAQTGSRSPRETLVKH